MSDQKAKKNPQPHNKTHPKLSDRELDILYRSLSCLKGVSTKGEPVIDFDLLATAVGYASASSVSSVWYAVRTKLAQNSSIVSSRFPSTAPPGTSDDQSLLEDTQHAATTMMGNEEVSGAGNGGTKRKVSELDTSANASLDDLIEPNLGKVSTLPEIPEGDAVLDTGGDETVPAKKAKKARVTKTPVPKKKAAKKPAAKKPAAVKKDNDAKKNKEKGKAEYLVQNPYGNDDGPKDEDPNGHGEYYYDSLLRNANDAETFFQSSLDELEPLPQDDAAEQSFDAHMQRAWDDGLIPAGFGPGEVFGTGSVPPLPPRGYGFGMGTYDDYDDDENASFTPFQQ
ncbi:hypothetical protein F5X97DRAFT_346151 [Nemania serpens]|nr:hypothetical protein F5X97DRAFT_346151 [Nemania serpens]